MSKTYIVIVLELMYVSFLSTFVLEGGCMLKSKYSFDDEMIFKSLENKPNLITFASIGCINAEDVVSVYGKGIISMKDWKNSHKQMVVDVQNQYERKGEKGFH